jgi:ketosteroid isomerase-like protein
LRLAAKHEQRKIDQENIMLDNKDRELSASGARKPEDCDRILLAALEAGDIETSVALYEPTAVLFKKSGETMTGHELIRVNNAALIALKPVFYIEQIVTTLNGDGTIATTRMKARLEGMQADGKPVNSAIHTLEVLRRQHDGSWRYVIDDPFGSMRASMGERSSP